MSSFEVVQDNTSSYFFLQNNTATGKSNLFSCSLNVHYLKGLEIKPRKVNLEQDQKVCVSQTRNGNEPSTLQKLLTQQLILKQLSLISTVSSQFINEGSPYLAIMVVRD